MYKIDIFSDNNIFQKGFNNYALKSLINFCNVVDQNGNHILNDYAESRKLQVGCDEIFLNKMYKKILENKNLIVDRLNELPDFNYENNLSDNMIIAALIKAIQLTSNKDILRSSSLEIEYMIANAIIHNDEIFSNIFSNELLKNTEKAIDTALIRFFEHGDDFDLFKKEVINQFLKKTKKEYSDEEFASFLKNSFFGEDLLDTILYNFDFSLIDEPEDVVESAFDGEVSLDELLEIISDNQISNISSSIMRKIDELSEEH